MAGRDGVLNIQATCVAVDDVGVLLRGPSGSGKSDLALRLIDGGAQLVADDLVAVTVDGARAVARLPDTAPPECRGRLEVRGLGLLPVPTVASAVLGLVAELFPGGHPDRQPEPETVEIAGISLRLIRLDPFGASAPARIRLVSRLTRTGIIPAP